MPGNSSDRRTNRHVTLIYKMLQLGFFLKKRIQKLLIKSIHLLYWYIIENIFQLGGHLSNILDINNVFKLNNVKHVLTNPRRKLSFCNQSICDSLRQFVNYNYHWLFLHLFLHKIWLCLQLHYNYFVTNVFFILPFG